jgi:hypothetical protein
MAWPEGTKADGGVDDRIEGLFISGSNIYGCVNRGVTIPRLCQDVIASPASLAVCCVVDWVMRRELRDSYNIY